MNWIDLAIIILLFAFAYEGLGRPFIPEVVSLLSFVIAFLFSLKFYNIAARLIENSLSFPHSFANVLGFILVWYASEIVLFVLVKVSKIERLDSLITKFNIFSFLPALIKGYIFVSILLVLIGTFPLNPQVKKDVGQSKLGSEILSQTYKIEAPLRSIFGDIANDSLTFLTIKPEATESVNLGFRTDKYDFNAGLEMKMINLVNNERSQKDLPILQYDSRLRTVAREHSGDMLRRGYFAHLSPEGQNVAERAESINVKFLVIGENLAYAPSLDLAHNGLMNSPGHRANILSTDFHKIGIGIADGGEYGLMITQVFTN